MGQYTIGEYIREQKDKDSLEACFGTNWDKLSLAEIKNKYRKLSIDWHPDKNPAGEAMFKQLSKWYTALTDSEERTKLEADILAFNRANVYRTFAHNPADQHDNTEREGSSANSGHNWPPQPEPLQKQEQAIILKNLNMLMRQCNDYILNPAKPLSAAMISSFEETLQACLRLQNYQRFIFPYLRSIASINKFLEERFPNDEGNMREIHNLMQRIIPRQEAPSHSVPRRTPSSDYDESRRNHRPKTTSFHEIRNLVDDISEALFSYQQQQEILGYSYKKKYMAQILNTFDGIIKIYANKARDDTIKDDYSRLSLIHGIITNINKIDNLGLVLLNTDELMKRIKVIFNSSSDYRNNYTFPTRRRW